MNLITVKGVSKYKGDILILDSIDLSQQPMQNLAISGETGSGKSTLLKIIAGLIQPDKGQVFFQNERVLGPDEQLIAGHASIGYLSQHFELRNNYRVEELLEYANKIGDEEAKALFELCQISQLLKRRTDQLSGGEKQRIAIAKLLISSPQLLILDEPYSNLDMEHKNTMKSVIKEIDSRLNISCILVSHDPGDILSWADHIIVLKDGKIVQQGSPAGIYEDPANEYVAGLFGKFNIITINGEKRFVRPENLRIVRDNYNTLKGAIQNIYYFGSHFEIEILVNNQLLVSRTMELNNKVGDEVLLEISNRSDRPVGPR